MNLLDDTNVPAKDIPQDRQLASTLANSRSLKYAT
jgi:hypothetical protein